MLAKFLFKAACILSLLSMLGGLSTLQAQNFRGGISGIVTDPSGAVVPDAQVTATRVSTAERIVSRSSSAGEFAFQDLPIGSYNISIEATGFQPTTIEKVGVSGGAVYSLPVKLSPAKSSTTVNVTAAALSLDSTTATQTDVLPNRAVQDVPMNGRDFTQFIALSPGYGGYSAGGFGSMNGTRPNQINWQIEGTDNNDLWWNIPAVNQGGVSGIAGIVMPLDAIQEFSLITQGSPETGRNPGGTVNLIMKSGTDALHGSAYYYNRNEALAIQTPFAPPGTPKNKIRNQQYGFSFGGPFKKEKLFYFTAFEYQTFVIGNQSRSTEPSQAYQADAKAVLQNYGVPVNPVSTNLLNNLWPASALTGPATPNNYFNPNTENGHSYNGVIKLDQNINEKNHLTERWYAGQGTQTAPTASLLSPYYEVAPIHVQNYAIIYNTMFTASLSNQLFVGVNYFNQVFADANQSYNPVALGLNTGVTNPSLSGSPRINISPAAGGSGFDPIGITPNSGRNDITGHLDDALSYVHGRHEYRMGGEFRQAQVDDFYQSGQRGTFTFDGTQGPWSATPTGGALTPCLSEATQNVGNPEPSTIDPNLLGLADFLAGCVSTSSIVQGDPKRQVFVNNFDLFAQDAWQLNSRLNLNYGIRYDYVGPIHNSTKDLSTFLPTAANGIAVAGQNIGLLYPQYWKNFSPRVGFAYQPGNDGNLVVRGGFGLYFDTPNMVPFLNERATNNGGPFGIQDNPAGASPVTDVTKDNYVIVQNQLIFPSQANTTCEQNLQSPSCPLVSLFAVSQHFRPAYFYSYDLNVQKALTSSILLQVGYVGTEGRRLLNIADINQAALNPQGTNTTQQEEQVTRPYYSQFPNFSVINQIISAGTSNYNAMQSTLTMRNTHGLTMQANYTWSHSLDEMSQIIPILPQNSFNLRGNYGNSAYDTRNNFNAYVLYNLPGLAEGPRELTHGWQVNGLFNFHGGQPFSVFANGNYSGTGENQDRVDQIAPPFAGVSHQLVANSYVQWVNPNAFVNPNPGSYGTMRRNQIYGPGFSDVDLSVFKNSQITHRVNAQFRVEMYNLFNRLNLAPPSNSLGGGFGQSSTTIGAYNGAPGIGPGEPFNTQLALKLLF